MRPLARLRRSRRDPRHGRQPGGDRAFPACTRRRRCAPWLSNGAPPSSRSAPPARSRPRSSTSSRASSARACAPATGCRTRRSWRPRSGSRRPTLRQALRVLESAGLLSVRRGAGGGIFVISDLVPTEALTTSIALEEEVIVRRPAAPGACSKRAVAEHAMQVMREDDVSELERTVDLLRAAIGNRKHVMRADGMFHRAIVRAAHSRTLEAAMRARRPPHGADPRRLLGRGRARPHDARSARAPARGDAWPRHRGPRGRARRVHFGMLEDVVAAQRGVERDALFGVPVTLGR